MAIIIIVVAIALYLILFGFAWHNLDTVEGQKRIAYIIISTIIIAIITLITFNMSTSGIDYQNTKIEGSIRNMLVAIFTPINGLIVIPYLANMLSKISLEKITQKEFKTKAVIMTIILLIVLIFECGYLKDIQLGIIEMMQQK